MLTLSMTGEMTPLPSRTARRLTAGAFLLVFLVMVLGASAPRAQAVILPSVTIDGPSEDIVGFGGIAMAEDGTGGVVYLKRVDGVAHVFVSRFVEGHWLAPVRVDNEEPYAASWARIGAADGGELVVVWATPFATFHERPVDELLGSTLGAGAATFGRAILVDPDIEGGTGTSPDLAMSSTGQADVVYRVVDEQSTLSLLRPEDVIEEVRVAHYNGQRWSRLGAINRTRGVSMRPPTQMNAPQIAIGPTGNGVVVWQEPEINGVARIWARRIFGASLDYVLPVAAASFDNVPIGDDADAPSVAISRLGQAEVAYRQLAGPGSPLPGPRIFLNTLPDGEAHNGSEFAGAVIADPNVSGGLSAKVGPPTIDIDEKYDLRLLYASNGTPRVVEGNDQGLAGTLTLGPPFVGAEEMSASIMNPSGGGVSAWPSADANGDPALAVREDFPEGAVQTALLSGGNGGPIGELAVGRSGLGDGLVAFMQGPLGDAAIVGTEASAPPAQLILSLPRGWIKPSQLQISWQPATSANGPLLYHVVLDGHPLPTPPGTFALALDSRGLGDGSHDVQVLATDIDGQSILSPPSVVHVNGTPPVVKISRASGGFGVSVRVSDAYSGLKVSTVNVNFGDGHGARRHSRFTHRYAHGGIYEVTVSAADKIGNAGVVRELVKVR